MVTQGHVRAMGMTPGDALPGNAGNGSGSFQRTPLLARLRVLRRSAVKAARCQRFQSRRPGDKDTIWPGAG